MEPFHFVLVFLIIATLWLMGIINLVPGRWTEEKAKKELADLLNKDSNKGIFK